MLARVIMCNIKILWQSHCLFQKINESQQIINEGCYAAGKLFILMIARGNWYKSYFRLNPVAG
jgi:hypothetical protein